MDKAPSMRGVYFETPPSKVLVLSCSCCVAAELRCDARRPLAAAKAGSLDDPPKPLF